MADLNEVLIFTRVVQAGSFTKAASRLGLPKSTVSAKVQGLERRLGVSLLHRTTRSLRVTEAGELYFQKCVQALEQIESAESAATTAQAEPQGVLRVTAPVEFGTSFLPELSQGFLKKYPQVTLELLLTDRIVDLVAERVDLAIRAGALEDSSMIAKKLGSDSFIAVAAPSYLKRKGTPRHPNDLTQHDCLRFTVEDEDRSWELLRGKQAVEVAVSGPFGANNLSTLKDLAILGVGIALVPAYLCRNELLKGALIRVLPQWATPTGAVHAVYPAHRFVSPKVRAFIEFAIPALKSEFDAVAKI